MPVLLSAVVGAALCVGASLAVTTSGGAESALPDNQLNIADTLPPISDTTSTSAEPTTSTAPTTTTTAVAPPPAVAAPVVQKAPTQTQAQAQPQKAPVAVKGGYDPSLDVQAAINAALSRSSKVLLNFGDNDCPACKSLDAAFSTPGVKAALASYEVVKIDLGKNMKTMKQYDPCGSYSMPVLIVLNGGQMTANTNTCKDSPSKVARPQLNEAGMSTFLANS